METVEPLHRESVPELEDVFEEAEDRLGYVPRSHLAIARSPEVLRALAGVERVGLWAGSLEQRQRHLLGAIANAVSGNAYCWAQCGVGLSRAGVSGDTVMEILTRLDTTSLLDERTRVSLQFARSMASIPNRVEEGHFGQLRKFYDEAEIIEIAFVVALYGFLHRLTGMLGSALEPAPREWATTYNSSSTRPPVADDITRPVGDDGGRLAPLDERGVPELADVFTRFRDSYVPNSFLVMARRPDLVRAMIELWASLVGTRTIAPDLAYMASWVSSFATGCQYCQAHTSLHASNHGVAAEKIENLWMFESSELFRESERVALRLAIAGASQPSGMTDDLADQLRTRFDERQIVELMLSIASFGFYNRWNDTFATPLEDQPFEFASEHLVGAGWTGSHHGRTTVAPPG